MFAWQHDFHSQNCVVDAPRDSAREISSSGTCGIRVRAATDRRGPPPRAGTACPTVSREGQRWPTFDVSRAAWLAGGSRHLGLGRGSRVAPRAGPERSVYVICTLTDNRQYTKGAHSSIPDRPLPLRLDRAGERRARRRRVGTRWGAPARHPPRSRCSHACRPSRQRPLLAQCIGRVAALPCTTGTALSPSS